GGGESGGAGGGGGGTCWLPPPITHLSAPPERLPKSGRSVCATRGASASIGPRATCTSPTSDRACMRRSTCNRPGAAVTTTGGTSRRGYIAFGRPPAVQWQGSYCPVPRTILGKVRRRAGERCIEAPRLPLG